MAKEATKLRTEPSDEPHPVVKRQELTEEQSERSEEYCHDADVHAACLDLYGEIEKGFTDQWDRANDQIDFWDIYNCILGPKQFYSGNSKIYIPLISDAVDARTTRFTNQIFPQSGKNVEVITSESKPQDLMSLLEFYIRKCRLRSEVIPPLIRNGDVEGQYNLYMSWVRNEHDVTWRVKKKEDVEIEGEEVDIDGDEYDDIEEDSIIHQYPDVEVLADADVLVLPHTAKNVQAALAAGGSATVIRRWSKSKIKKLIDDGDIDEEYGEELLELFSSKNASGTPNKAEKMVEAAGIKHEGGKTVALVYETWTMLKLDGKRRIARIIFGGPTLVASCKRNPYWCDQVPLISAPSKRLQGSFKGESRVKKLQTMQYAANDAINEAMDSAAYALMPIVMTDPLKNPRTSSMILSVAAIWETNPQDTQFAKFPDLWKDGFEIVGQFRGQIFQTLGVNPAMIPSSDQKSGKTNQAKVAQEQMVDILTTADVVTDLEESILTPVLRWMIYLDHQYRTDDITVRQFGVQGAHMNMDMIPPVQMDRRFEVKWFGVEAARSAQQMQLQMAGLNMVRGLPPQLYPGFELNLAPVIQQFLENLFGPRLAGQIFTDARKRLSLEPEFENTLLEAGFEVPVQVLDNDQEHMQAHMQALQESPLGDPSGVLRKHMIFHQMQMQKKQQAAMAQQQQMLQGQQGMPGGAGPGAAGTPRQGARPAGPRGGQGPAGMIHQDQLRDPAVMPRR